MKKSQRWNKRFMRQEQSLKVGIEKDTNHKKFNDINKNSQQNLQGNNFDTMSLKSTLHT